MELLLSCPAGEVVPIPTLPVLGKVLVCEHAEPNAVTNKKIPSTTAKTLSLRVANIVALLLKPYSFSSIESTKVKTQLHIAQEFNSELVHAGRGEIRSAARLSHEQTNAMQQHHFGNENRLLCLMFILQMNLRCIQSYKSADFGEVLRWI